MKILNLSKLSLACAVALIASPLATAVHAADAPATTPATGTDSKPATDDKDKDKPERKRGDRPPGERGMGGPRPGGLAERYNRSTPEERTKLETDLGLNDDQKAKLKTAAEKFKTDSTALKEDKTITDEKDKRGKQREIGKTFGDSLDSILTAEQKEKLKDIQKKHMEEMAKNHPKRDGKPGDKPDAKPEEPAKP